MATILNFEGKTVKEIKFDSFYFIRYYYIYLFNFNYLDSNPSTLYLLWKPKISEIQGSVNSQNTKKITFSIRVLGIYNFAVEVETSKPNWHYCRFSLPPPQLSKHGMSISLTSLRHSSSFKETIDHTDAKLILFENSFCSLQRIASLGTKRSTCFFYRVFFEKEKINHWWFASNLKRQIINLFTFKCLWNA